MKDNWDKIQEIFYQQSVDEQDEILDFFNAAIKNCGKNLFAEHTMPRDFENFILHHPENLYKTHDWLYIQIVLILIKLSVNEKVFPELFKIIT